MFGGLPAVLALHARGLALPVLFIAAWVGLALLWGDPTFQRDQLWRREQRYGRLFGGRWVATVASAIAFSWAHIVLLNGGAHAAGWLALPRTYLRTRSLLATAVGHGAYGCLLFTVGLGRWFVTGG